MNSLPDQHKSRGMILGAVIGDAMGMPYQFLHPQVVKESFDTPAAAFHRAPEGHVNAGLDKGQYTDETQLMSLVAESLLEKGDVDPAAIAETMVRFYTAEEWITPGRTIISACRHLRNGSPWAESGSYRDGSKPLAMVPPLVIHFFNDPDALLHHSATLSRIILVEPRVASGAMCFALLLRHIMLSRDEKDLTEGIRETGAYMDAHGAAFRGMLEWVLTLRDTDIQEGLEELGTGYSVLETLFASLFAFLKFPRDFAGAVSNVVFAGDNADTTGFITGAFCGAFAGVNSIPEHLQSGVKDGQFFQDLADKLLANGQSS